jgi:zona occludens toxin
MAINTYTGLQGSGKSFEVVSGPILDAIAQGRRVVTNVAGIDQDRIHDYLEKKRGLDVDKLGVIVHVSNERVMEPQFFPDEEKPELVSVVQGGDLVAIDEAWRCWGTDKKLTHEHMQFFRMHRHYVHPDTAVTCDVVVMTQDIAGLNRALKNVIEFAFKMHKLKSLGLSSRYRVEIYEGSKLTKSMRIDQKQKKYDPEIFPLYQSYTGGKGMEKAIDSRQNIFASSALWVMVGGVALVASIGFFFTWRFFHPVAKVDPKASASASPSGPARAGDVPVGPVGGAPHFSDSWRVVGHVAMHGDRWVVVSNGAGQLRVESPSVFYGEGLAVIGDIDGDKVTRWSGPRQEKTAGGASHHEVPK